jgi:hypothetical protein
VAQQGDGPFDVAGLSHIKADPACVWEQMVGLGPASRYHFIPYPLGKGYVQQSVTVNVAQLSPAQPVLSAAETMGMGRDALPTQ